MAVLVVFLEFGIEYLQVSGNLGMNYLVGRNTDLKIVSRGPRQKDIKN
jgi:hypothetical protein